MIPQPEPEPEREPQSIGRAKPQLQVNFQIRPLAAQGESGPSSSDALDALSRAFHNQFKTYRVAGSKLVSYSVAQDGAEEALGALKNERAVQPARKAGRGVWVPFEILPRQKETDLHAKEALVRLEERLSEPGATRGLVCGVPAHERTSTQWERHTRVIFEVLPAAADEKVRTPTKALVALRRVLAEEPRVRTSHAGTTARVAESVLGEDSGDKDGSARWIAMEPMKKKCTPLAERVSSQLRGLRQLDPEKDKDAAFGLQQSDLDDLLNLDDEPPEMENVDSTADLDPEQLFRLETVLRQGGDEKLAPVVSARLSELQLRDLLRMSARSPGSLAVGAATALELSLRSNGVATELEIARQVTAARKEADGENPRELQLQPLANRVAGAFTSGDFDNLLSESDEAELQNVEMTARRQKVKDGSPLWFGSVQKLMEKAMDVLDVLSVDVCRYCAKCEDATEFATDGFLSSKVTRPWVFAGFECENRHPDFFYRDQVPNRIMDTLYAAREVEEYRIEAERAQGRRDAYAALLQTRREQRAATVIQSCVRRQSQQRSYARIRKVLICSQAVVRGMYDRRLVQQHHSSLPKVQAHCRRKLVELSYRNISRAPRATTIQAVWRGHRMRNRIRRRSCVAAWPAAKVAAVIQWLHTSRGKSTEQQQLPSQIVLRLTTPPVIAQWKSDDTAAKITFRRRGDTLLTVGSSRQQWCTHRGVLDQATVFAEMIVQRLDLFHNMYGTDTEHLIGSQQKAGRFLRIPITLPDEDPADFANLLHFMYGLPVRLTIGETVQLYHSADRFGAAAAMEETFAAITRWVSEGKCCEVYDAGRRSGAKRVVKYCWKHIVRLLEYMVADPTSDIDTLSSNSLLSVIQSTELVVRSEEIILKLVLRWVMADLHDRFCTLAGCLLCIQWALLPHEILQAAVTDEVKLAQLLRLGKFASWHGHNSVTALLARLRQSNAIVRAVDKAFRSEIFENVVELSEELDTDHLGVDPLSSQDTLATSSRHYTPLQNIEEERAVMSEYLAAEVDSSGTPWYLVAHRWMVSWLEHVNYWQRSLHPGPIDNTCLLTDDGLTRSHLKEGMDFDLVSEEVWRALMKWYGGGPELRRRSYWDRLHGYEVEVSPPKLRVGLAVHDATPRQLKTMEISRYCRIGDLIEQSCRLHNIQRWDIEELAIWEWSSSLKHVRWSRRLPRTQIQAIEARSLKEVSIGDGDTCCLKLTAKAREAFSRTDTTIGLQLEESRHAALELTPGDARLQGQIEIPSRPKFVQIPDQVDDEATKDGGSDHQLDVAELSTDEETSTSEAGLSTAEEEDDASSSDDNLCKEHDRDDVQNVAKMNAAGHLTAAGKRAQHARVQKGKEQADTCTAEQPMTVARMLGLVQKELGIPPDDEQNIASAVQHVEEASGIAIDGTLKDRLQNVAVELGVVRVTVPRVASGRLTSSLDPQLAKIQSQMDHVLALLTGQSQREEMQQLVKAVGMYERVTERRRDASQLNATKEARRNALPMRPTAAKLAPPVQKEPSLSPQPPSLVDRLLEAKREKLVEQEKAEAAVRSGIPPPPSITYQPPQEATCLQTAIQLLQRALVADKTANSNNHDSLVKAAAALTRAQNALLQALEPENHPEEAKTVLQEKLRHVRERMIRYIKSVSQTELKSAVSFLEGEIQDVVGQPWSPCFAQVIGHSQAESKGNVLYRFSSGCPSLHMGSLRTTFDTQFFTETSIASDCRTFLFAAVFDGHDGRQCAEFAQSHLWGVFQRHFHINGGNPVVAFQRAFCEVESGFGRTFFEKPSQLFAAACCTAVFIDAQSCPQRICVANIGTCRAVHSSGKQVGARQLTCEHSCEELSERLRVQHQHPDALRESEKGLLGLCRHTRALGGLHMKDRRVAELWNTQNFRRVHPLPGSSLTNAIGQRREVAPYLTSRVGIESIELAEDDFVIIATSGFWRCLSNEDAVLLASKLLAGAREARASLTNIAQAMLAECETGDEDQDDVALLLITADGSSTAAHNNHDFHAHREQCNSSEPEPPPALRSQPTTRKARIAGPQNLVLKQCLVSNQPPPPPPPATPPAPISLQALSRLHERRGAVTTTGASGLLLNTPAAESPRPSPRPMLKPARVQHTEPASPAARIATTDGTDSPSNCASSGLEGRLATDLTISRLRARRGAVTTCGSGGSRSVGADDSSPIQSTPQTSEQSPPHSQKQLVADIRRHATVEYVDQKRAELKALMMPHRVPRGAPRPAWRPAPPERINTKQAAVAKPMLRSLTLKERMASVADSWGILAASESIRKQHSKSLQQRMAAVAASWQSAHR